MTSHGFWQEFEHDPRSPEYAALRASDRDRDLVLRELGEAYATGRLDRVEFDERSDAVQAARTLGELPGLLGDLLPVVPVTPAPAVRDPDARAVEKYESERRQAIWGFIAASTVCWVIWLVTSWPGDHPWPVWVMLASGVNAGRVLFMREEMIAEERRRLEKKQRKSLGSDQPPPELEDPAED